MAYEKLNWQNGKPPALNAENLNHMEDGIVGAEAAAAAAAVSAAEAKKAVEAMADPMGTWKYIGKFTKENINVQKEIYTFKPNETFSSVVNEVLVVINNIKESSTSSGSTIQAYFNAPFGARFSRLFAYVVHDSSLELWIGSKFLVQKINGRDGYAYYIGQNDSSSSSSQPSVLAYKVEITSPGNYDKMFFTLSVGNSRNITECDIDVWYR